MNRKVVLSENSEQRSENIVLSEMLIESLNKKIGHEIAYNLEDMESPVDTKDWLSTGSTILDMILSNKPEAPGGIPLRRLIEISGESGCVTEDTEVMLIFNTLQVHDREYWLQHQKKYQIKEVKRFLEEGREVRIKTAHNKFCNVSEFIDKGVLDTFLVTLSNGRSIKVTDDHRFFTNSKYGWMFAKDMIVGETEIYCDDNKYYKVTNVECIGEHRIVDLSVDDEHSYFGNGMLCHNTGKSLLAYLIMKDCNDRGGIPVLIDTEYSANIDFLEMLGLKPRKNLVYLTPDTVEEVFTCIEETIKRIRESNKNKLCVIVWDSIAGTSTKAELQGEYGDATVAMQARMIGQGLRKIIRFIGKQNISLIFLNQLRSKINAGPFADPYCVDPYTTKIWIYRNNDIEEISLSEFAKKLEITNDFETPGEYDIQEDIKILSYIENKDGEGNCFWSKINKFVVKESVKNHYELYNLDKTLKCTGNHRVLYEIKDRNGQKLQESEWIHAKDIPGAKLINEPMRVVDLEVNDTHCYMANGQINHNTTPGGMAIPFFASIRLRLYTSGKMKVGDNVIGIGIKAKVVKNRMAPPFRECKLQMYLDRGVIDEESWLDVGTKLNIFEKLSTQKSTFEYNGEKVEFKNRDFVDFIRKTENSEMRDFLKTKIKEGLYIDQKNIKQNGDEEVVVEELSGDEEL